MEIFLEKKARPHLRRIKELEAELISRAGFEVWRYSLIIKLPSDLAHLCDQRSLIHETELLPLEEFANLLRKSFFINLYAHLESHLVDLCYNLDEEWLTKGAKKRKENILKQAMNYLIRSQHIEFELGTNQEWPEIMQYRLLRNCIVHNRGRLNERFQDTQGKLRKYLERKKLLDVDEIILDKDFCKETFDTIERFLDSVLVAYYKNTTNA